MHQIVFIGYLGEGFGDFLQSLSDASHEVSLCAVAFGVHHQAFRLCKCSFDLIDIKRLPTVDEVYAIPKIWDILFPNSFFILWNGMHGIYSVLAQYFKNERIPFLVAEYSAIRNLYSIDESLYGSEVLSECKLSNIDFPSRLDLKYLENYIIPRYDNQLANNDEIQMLAHDVRKKILYLGVWDEAAGLTEPNSCEQQREVSPIFRSSYEAVVAVADNVVGDENILLIIKPHPNCTREEKHQLKLLAAKHDYLYLDANIVVYDLIKIVDVVITISSTLAFVALYHRKPLILLGRERLAKSGYFRVLEREDMLGGLIRSVLYGYNNEKILSVEEIVLWYLLNDRMYTVDPCLIEYGCRTPIELCNKILNILRFQNERVVSVDPNLYFKIMGKMIETRDESIKVMEQMIDTRDESIKAMEQMIDARDKSIKAMEQMIDARDESIKAMEQMIDARDELIRELKQSTQVQDGKLKND